MRPDQALNTRIMAKNDNLTPLYNIRVLFSLIRKGSRATAAATSGSRPAQPKPLGAAAGPLNKPRPGSSSSKGKGTAGGGGVQALIDMLDS